VSSWEERMSLRMAERRFAEGQAAYEADGNKVYRSADEVWADEPDLCRDCCAPYEAIGTYYGWGIREVCGSFRGECMYKHKHHENDGPAIG
jgi:hypothetical protein